MLQPQQPLNLSPYGHLYDLLIPKDDELRRIHDEIHKNITKVLDKNDGFYFNKDAGTMTCPAGHLATHRMYNP